MYNFYFGNLLLPIPPQKLTTKIKGNNKTLTLVNEGDMNFLRAPGLTEISFDVTLPMLGQYSFANAFSAPDYYLSAFEKLKTERKPFRFIVSRTSPSGRLLYDTNIQVSLESYDVTEDASKGPDVVVAISLKQYIDYQTKLVTVVKPPTPAAKPVVAQETPRPAPTAPKTQTYTVKTGDCLWTIAKKFYGDGSQYPKIYNANKDKIKNPNLIYTGQVFVIP